MKVDRQKHCPQKRAETRGSRDERLRFAKELERVTLPPCRCLVIQPHVVLQKVDGRYEVAESRNEVGDSEKCDQFLGSRADLRQHEEGEDDEDGAQAGEGAGDERDVAGSRPDTETGPFWGAVVLMWAPIVVAVVAVHVVQRELANNTTLGKNA